MKPKFISKFQAGLTSPKKGRVDPAAQKDVMVFWFNCLQVVKAVEDTMWKRNVKKSKRYTYQNI